MKKLKQLRRPCMEIKSAGAGASVHQQDVDCRTTLVVHSALHHVSFPIKLGEKTVLSCTLEQNQ
jgi:hypothetical protein